MKLVHWLLVAFFAVALAGCTQYVTKDEFAPKMYSDHPTTIVVLPPINKSTAADAKEYYATTVAEPLTNSGYYVFPMEVVYDILQQEGLFDTETMINVPVQKYKEFFGADAVLYVTIEQWDTKYFVTAGSVTVKAICELKSTVSGDVLWFYDEAVEVNTSGDSGGATGLAGLLAKAISTAIKTATQSYIPLARNASEKMFLAMPFGKYHKQYNQDQKAKVEKKEAQAKSQQTDKKK